MSRDICLLLTSTIEARNKSFLKRNDTQTRLSDYKGALEKWLTRQKTLDKIVYADNSGYDLDELREYAKGLNRFEKQIEFISFETKGYTKAKGKSYGEIDTIRYALHQSKLLSDSTYFAKATGRLFFPNVDRFVPRLPSEFDFISNFSNNLAYTDTTLMIFKTSTFIDRILDYSYKHIDEENREYLERVFAKSILRCIADDYRWFPFPEELIVEGMSGTKDKPYGRGRLKSLRGTLISRLYYNFYRTSYGKNQPHLLEVWGVPPGGNPITNE